MHSFRSYVTERGLLSNTQKRVSQETHILAVQNTLLERGAQAESSRGREPREQLCLLTVSGFLVVRSVFPVTSAQSSCLGPYLVQFQGLPGSADLSQ